MDNNLKTYLEDQIKEYREESESLKNLYGDMMEHIEECKVQIRSLKAKEDVGFSMLSPISVDSTYRQQIDRIQDQLETFEKQKDKYKNDIQFYDGKIEEIQLQLEAYEQQFLQSDQQSQKEQSYDVDTADSSTVDIETHGTYDSKAEAMDQKTEIRSENETMWSRQDAEYVLHKLSEIKGYLSVDLLRSQLEIDQLTQFIKEKWNE